MRDRGLLMAKNNRHPGDPVVFVLSPKMEFPNYHSIEEMFSDDKPDDFKQNHIHANEVKTLTSYKITTNSTSEIFERMAENGIIAEILVTVFLGTGKDRYEHDQPKQQSEFDSVGTNKCQYAV